MKITAILLTYYKERLTHIPQIVEDVWNQSIIPQELIIINNNPELKLPKLKATVINCSRNFQTDIRIAIGALVDATHIFQLDDDASIKPRVLENLINWYKKLDNPIVSYYGRNFNNDNKESPYWTGKRIHSRSTERPLEMNHVGARISLIRREVFAEALKVFANIPDYPRNGGEDILTSLVNKYHFKKKNYLVPAKDDYDWIDLGEKGIGLSRHKAIHSKNRDDSVKLLWKYYKQD